MNYAFINAENIVTQVISGLLNAQQQEQFLRDYTVPFGAVAIIEVNESTRVWIGGTYNPTDNTFTPPPPPPEPEPPVVEPEIDPEIDPEIAAIVERLDVIEADLGIATGAPE